MDWPDSFAPLEPPAVLPATVITGVFQIPNGAGSVGFYYIGLPAPPCACKRCAPAQRRPDPFPLGAVIAIIQLPNGGMKSCNLKVHAAYEYPTPGSLIFCVNSHTVFLDDRVLYRTREPGETKWVDKTCNIAQFLTDMGIGGGTTLPAPSFEPLMSAPADLLARIEEGGRLLGKEPRELITLLQSSNCYYAYDGKSIIVDTDGNQFWLQRRP